jgi:hypothetical protein
MPFGQEPGLFCKKQDELFFPFIAGYYPGDRMEIHQWASPCWFDSAADQMGFPA